jgi:hypothetical protein
MKRLLTPAVVLFFLSPAIGELLSSSSPPAEFFNPFILLLQAALYGSGALLVRELARRWNKGWPTILLLGAAYGIVEEGLAVKSFFDPNWVDLGPAGDYSRWLGVNWVWSAGLTFYHAVISIGIPILLVTVLFPAERDRAWLSPRGTGWIATLFVAVTVFINVALTPYRPTLLAHLVSLAAVLGLAAWARRMPWPWPAVDRPALRSTWRLGLTGFGATFGLFFLLWFLTALKIPPVVWIVLALGYAVFLWLRVGRLSTAPGWGPRHSLALASGALSFFILLSPLTELDPNRIDNTTGMTLVGLATAGFLVWAARRVRSREAAATPA